MKTTGAERPRGVTLLEILAVIALLSILFAFGAAAFLGLRQRMSDQGLQVQLENTLRRARNEALRNGVPAYVAFETKNEKVRVRPWFYRPVAHFSFEGSGPAEAAKGALKRELFFKGAEIHPAGEIGACLALSDMLKGGDGHASAGNDGDFDLENGGYLECYLFAFPSQQASQKIFQKKGAYELGLEHGFLTGKVGRKKVAAIGFQIPFRRWTKVALAWDERNIRLLVDDTLVGWALGEPTPITDHDFVIGAEDGGSVSGRVDEVRVLAVNPGSALELPRGAKLEHNVGPLETIFFSPDGHLDPRYHGGDLRLDLLINDKKRSVLISLLGLTNRLDAESTKPKEEDSALNQWTDPARNPAKPVVQPLLPDLATPAKKGAAKDDMPGVDVAELDPAMFGMPDPLGDVTPDAPPRIPLAELDRAAIEQLPDPKKTAAMVVQASVFWGPKLEEVQDAVREEKWEDAFRLAAEATEFQPELIQRIEKEILNSPDLSTEDKAEVRKGLPELKKQLNEIRKALRDVLPKVMPRTRQSYKRAQQLSRETLK